MSTMSGEGTASDSLYGAETYKARGSPMFTKLWTYDELLAVERPPGRFGKKKKDQHDMERPANWPPDTDVERGSWVYWLPEGWAQGVRTQELSGKQLKCFMSPEGKRFWHKPDVEKFLGRKLASVEPRKKSEGDESSGPNERYVTDPDAIPHWPEDEEDWLPKDFKIAFRQLPSRLHRVYVPPGKEDEGFLYHRATVAEWLAGKASLSPFGTSKPMAEISAQAAEKGKGGTKRKRASIEDYIKVDGMTVVNLAGDYTKDVKELERANVQNIEKVARDAQDIRDKLKQRKFQDVSLRYCTHASEQPPYIRCLAGFYYKRPETVNEHAHYQKIELNSEASTGVHCTWLYLSWVQCWGGHWKLGTVDGDFIGVAICKDPAMNADWMCLDATICEKAQLVKYDQR